MRLPAVLQPWSAALSVLDVELAIALGPLVRQLDQLITRQDPGPGAHGPLDGYDGITRRGSPTRLLASEWALADAAPAEFLRRAATTELLYLEPVYQQDRLRGRIAVLVDAGPDQLGAARLVQLATLIVMMRRASARGHQLSIGVLGDEPGQWRSDDPYVLLRAWLGARRAADTDPAEVDRWLEDIREPDETWLLAGPGLAAALPGRRRLLVTRECAWDAGGATAAEIRLDGDRVELALPRHDLAVKALRGAAFRLPGEARLAPRLRFPAFTGSPLRLLARGNEPDELVASTVARNGDPPSRPRRYRLDGPALAASVFSRRLVALVVVEDELRAQVVGKPLGHLDRLAVPLEVVGLTTADVHDAAACELPALYFDSGALTCRIAGKWWRLHPTEHPRSRDLLAVAPSGKLDEPRIVYRHFDQVMEPPNSYPASTSVDRVVLGHDRMLAWYDGEAWLVEPGRTRIRVPDDGEPVGLLLLDGVPTLVCRSHAGLMVRLCSATGQRTLTNFPDVRSRPSLHPFEPLLIIELADRIDVLDLAYDRVVATLRTGR